VGGGWVDVCVCVCGGGVGECVFVWGMDCWVGGLICVCVDGWVCGWLCGCVCDRERRQFGVFSVVSI